MAADICPRVTGPELKQQLRRAFPGVAFSVTRLRSPYANFLTVRWDWTKVARSAVAAVTDQFDDERDPMADGVRLGSQQISLRHTGSPTEAMAHRGEEAQVRRSIDG